MLVIRIAECGHLGKTSKETEMLHELEHLSTHWFVSRSSRKGHSTGCFLRLGLTILARLHRQNCNIDQQKGNHLVYLAECPISSIPNSLTGSISRT